MSISSTSAIELVEQPRITTSQRQEQEETASPHLRTSIEGVNYDPVDENAVFLASQQADSTVPDGGYGWVVITACATLTWWFVGTSYIWGIIQASLVAKGLASPSTLSFVGSLTVACIAIFAIINARIIRWLGARNTALTGVLLLSAGEILSGWCTESIAGLFICSGLISGIGSRYVPRLVDCWSDFQKS
jgi:hypothetical protein